MRLFHEPCPSKGLQNDRSQSAACTPPQGLWRAAAYEERCHVAVPGGLCPVGALRSGDRVLTRDAGAQPVRWIGASTLPGIGRAAPIRFARGAPQTDDRTVLIMHIRHGK